MTAALEREFDRCRDWLAAALACGPDAHRTIHDIRDLVLSGKAQLWPGEEAAMVSQVVREPDGLCAHVFLGGGRLTSLLALQPGAEAWARAMGCSAASINGRGEWAGVLRKSGWAPVRGELRKDLI